MASRQESSVTDPQVITGDWTSYNFASPEVDWEQIKSALAAVHWEDLLSDMSAEDSLAAFETTCKTLCCTFTSPRQHRSGQRRRQKKLPGTVEF